MIETVLYPKKQIKTPDVDPAPKRLLAIEKLSLKEIQNYDHTAAHKWMMK